MAYSKFYSSLKKQSCQYNGLNSTSEIIKFLIKTKPEDILFTSDDKSDELSTELRECGNSNLNEKNVNLNSLYKIYTDALFHAKSNIQKSYSFGNRSVVLYKMGLFQSCIIDIDYALKNGYPKSKQYKLIIRKAESLLMLKDFKKSSSTFIDALNNLDNTDVMLSIWKKRINDGLRLCEKQSIILDNPVPIELLLSYPQYEAQIDPINAEIPSMSSELCMKTNDIDGRGIFACTDITIGDVLAIELPYSYRLSTECFLTHCYNCLRYQINLIPCDKCCKVGFCSVNCRENSNSQLKHDLECGLMTEILSTKAQQLGLLAYATVARTPLATIECVLKRIDGEKSETDGNVNIGSRHYFSAISIETNESLREFDDLVDRSISSLFLGNCYMRMIQKHNYVNHTDNLIVMLSQAICKHLQGLPCNAHSLSEMSIPVNGSLESSSVNYVGNALYPALSLINHSCSPNAVRITMAGGQCVLKALANIRAGEQIFDNYSLHYATTPSDIRKQKLREQYYFDCQCTACVDNWPTFEGILQLPSKPEIICSQCKNDVSTISLFCSKCNISIEEKYKCFLVLESRLSVNMELLLRKRFEEVEKYLLDFSDLLYQIVKCPNVLFNQTSEMLKLIWSVNGATVSYF